MAKLFDIEEIKKDCFVETREETFKAKYWMADSVGDAEFEKEDGTEVCFPYDEYLQTWRCWDSEPTKEEKESIPFDPCFRFGE